MRGGSDCVFQEEAGCVIAFEIQSISIFKYQHQPTPSRSRILGTGQPYRYVAKAMKRRRPSAGGEFDVAYFPIFKSNFKS